MSGRRMAMAAAGPGPVEATAGTGARRVVISNFDSPGNPHYNGGGATVVEMIASRLAAHFQVTVVTASTPPRHGST